MNKFILLLALLPALAWLGGCASAPAEIPADLSPADFFQRAQEASDTGKYALALQYYQSFQERYPDERDRGLWARYEIALLHSKRGDEQAALAAFDELLALYAEEGADQLPQGPRILAEKVKAKLLAKRAGAQAETESPPPEPAPSE